MKFKFLFILLAISTMGIAEEKTSTLDWPREIIEKDYTITLYQPQLEQLKNNILEGRLALSVKKDNEDIIFGALWFNGRMHTDMETRMAVLEDMEIPMVKFPDIKDSSKIEKLKELIISDFSSIDLEMSIDKIVGLLENPDAEDLPQDHLSNNPPEIYYRSEPTVLVLIDGKPILKEVEGQDLKTVVNTPFFIVKKDSTYFLKGGEHWFSSKELESKNWKNITEVPEDVEKLAESKIDDTEEDPEKEDSIIIPKLIVTSNPSELILSNGEINYQPITGTTLLFVTNTENDIIMEISSQMNYVLLNGRWYKSKTLSDGEWEFVQPNDLPDTFSGIPDDQSISSVRVSIPGTPEALEAKYEQQMPQTAVVDRKTATTEVKYDGDPKFETMEGTTVKYAINTESTVLLINQSYYCVDDGIWFESKNAKGPWAVATERPEEVEEIPASAPVYNVKYVYIYDSTPDVVYVGYTPGYYNSYYYGGVVVYGTGYYYQPWYGMYYYPRPVTYGYGVHYNPYTGWGFSVGVSYGWFTFGVSSYHHSYWGPMGYRHGYRHGYHHGYHRGYHNGYRAGYARGKYNSRNAYNNHKNGVRQTSRSSRQMNNSRNVRTAQPSRKPNNVYTDRSGNVMRRDNNGNWKQQYNSRQGSQTNRSKPQTRPQTQNRQQLERDFQNRNRANTRYQNYPQQRTPSSFPSRGGGARPAPSRGGGGRRR
ncbi:hypothetical protein [Labilibacter marinus]|uniref:hypothetical protein n=1 Tax=Labilibacter marinus TaxID=1477105 RepID=UPI00082C4F00|nr:hypothetical protein [Labilibacter marinus]